MSMLDSVTSSGVPSTLSGIGSKITFRIDVSPALSELYLKSLPSSARQSFQKPCTTMRTFHTPTRLNSDMNRQLVPRFAAAYSASLRKSSRRIVDVSPLNSLLCAAMISRW